MRCPQCGTDNRAQARFCANCGTKLALVCPQCGTELSLNMRFCDQCGADLGLSPAVPAGARDTRVPSAAHGFTERLQRLVPKEYAERLLATQGQPHDERRTITILFCDIKGSTAMAENLDPEEVKEIMDGAFDLLIEPVYRYEGTLARLMGDAILAFFGAPIAHEDDPERACRAALDIIAGAEEYAARLVQERGITGFKVRVGIHTGLVVVGEVGSDLRVEYTAMGDAINLAARMESAAEAGTVLISEATHKLIASLFETEALGPTQVKGKAEPLRVYRVLAAKEGPGKVRGIPGLQSPLVGRERELAALQEALERLQAGVGGIVTIVGEAGIGKSRLVAESRTLCEAEARRALLSPSCHPEGTKASRSSGKEIPFVLAQGRLRYAESGEKILRFAQNDRLGGLQWAEGRCLSYGGSIAYLLWLDVLRGLLGVSLHDAPQKVGNRLDERLRALYPDRYEGIYPFLARLMSLPLNEERQARLDDMDAQDLKESTFAAVETLVGCACNEQPLVLVCEDLHWADPTSLELLERLLPATERSALLLIAVFRPVRDHGSWRFRALAQKHAERHTDLELESLTAAESQMLVANLLRTEDLPEVLRWRIPSRTEGNPFYVEEVIRSLIDRGAIVHDEWSSRWLATEEVAHIRIPDTLQGVLMARIDRLQEDAKRVLQMASVIGRVFLYRVLEAIAGEERRLDRHLGTLQREEMIRERARMPELEYIFKHELTREAAYNGLLKKERRSFHRQVAEALERLFPERIEEQLGLLAHHWECAGDARKATDYLLRAGDQARLMYAHGEAIDLYERALELLKGDARCEQVGRTLMKLGLTYHTAFDFTKSHQAYDEAFIWLQKPHAAPDSLPPAPHGLREFGGNPETLDPGRSATTVSAELIQHLFCGLVAATSELGIVPDAARSWDISGGGHTYVFHLRRDWQWTDGTPLTAGDFEFAWKRVLQPGTESYIAKMLYDVRGARAFHQGQGVDAERVGVRALDAHTLEVELEAPTGHFLQLLATVTACPVPRKVVEAHGSAWTEMPNLVTCGPFRLQSWQRDVCMILTRNPDYHGRFGGNLQRIELTIAPTKEWSDMLQAYEMDAVDALGITNFPPEELQRARLRHADEYISTPTLCTHSVAFVSDKAPFHDMRVRQAFAMALDSEAHALAVSGGALFPATGGWLPPGMPGHSPATALPFDCEQAHRLLAEAGYPQGRGFPPVRLLSWRDAQRQIEDLRLRWQQSLNVEIACEALEYDAYEQTMKRHPPHMFLSVWEADYPDPESFLRDGFPREEVGWQNGEYDRLAEAARQVMDQNQRMRLYAQADRILVEDAVLVPLLYDRRHRLIKPWVRNYGVVGRSGAHWKDIVIEPH